MCLMDFRIIIDCDGYVVPIFFSILDHCMFVVWEEDKFSLWVTGYQMKISPPAAVLGQVHVTAHSRSLGDGILELEPKADTE